MRRTRAPLVCAVPSLWSLTLWEGIGAFGKRTDKAGLILPVLSAALVVWFDFCARFANIKSNRSAGSWACAFAGTGRGAVSWWKVIQGAVNA